jgi:hypothetical protein
MDDILERVVLFLIIMIVAFGIGLFLIWLRRWRYIHSRPVGNERNRLIKEVNRLKNDGHSYSKRRMYLCRAGLSSDAADELLGEAEHLTENGNT